MKRNVFSPAEATGAVLDRAKCISLRTLLEDMIPEVFAAAGDTVGAVSTLALVRSVLPPKTFAARLSGLRCIDSNIGIGTFCAPDERYADRRAAIAAGAATPRSSLTSGSTGTARAGALEGIKVAPRSAPSRAPEAPLTTDPPGSALPARARDERVELPARKVRMVKDDRK